MRSPLRETCNRCGTERPVNPGLCAHCGHDQFTPLPLSRLMTYWLARLFNASPGTAQQNVPQPAVISSAPETVGRVPIEPSNLLGLRSVLMGESRFALLAHPVAWIVLPTLIALVFGGQAARAYQEWPVFASVLILIPAAIVYFNCSPLQPAFRRLWPPSLYLHWGWVLVGVAILLRLALQELLPFPRPVHEEIETGKHAYDILALGHNLQLEFRFTNIFGVIGFAIGDYTLESLRFIFRLASALSILVMALTLRRLAISWPVTLLAVFTMAGLRWLVIGGGIADELFTGLLFETLLLYCLVASYTSRNHALAWAGFAGFFAGILMYEYISYKMAILIAPSWWLWQAVRAKDTQTQRSALMACGLFIFFLALIALPAIHEIVSRPADNILFSGIPRHLRASVLDPVQGESFALFAYLVDIWQAFLQYAKLLFGWSDNITGRLYRMPDGSAILPLAGILFVVSFCYALWPSSANGLTRFAAISIITVALMLAIIADNDYHNRLFPAVPLLILMTGTALEAAYRRFDLLRLRPIRNIGFFVAALTVAILIGNVATIVQLASAENTRWEYDNNGFYTICGFIADEPYSFQQVYVRADGAWCTPTHELWLYPDIPTDTISNVPHLPDAAALPSGTLVVRGDTHGLSEQAVAEFVNLAISANSVHTLRTRNNLEGHTTAMTFCYECATSGVPAPTYVEPAVADSNLYHLEPNPEETAFQVGVDQTFTLVSNGDHDIWVALNPLGTTGARFAHPQTDQGCPNPPENAGVYLQRHGDAVTIRACEPGPSQIWLYLAGTETVVRQYHVIASVDPPTDASSGATSHSDGLSISPDPAGLNIRAAPTQHHALHLHTDQSALLVPRPPDALALHNNPDLQGKDGCQEAPMTPEGDTRLLIILPSPGTKTQNPFYLVGCAPGEAALDIIIDGQLQKTYRFAINPP